MADTLNITKERALCILFCKEYNQENVKQLAKRIQDLKDMDVCYIKDPREPVIVPLDRIFLNPYKYQRYTVLRTGDNEIQNRLTKTNLASSKMIERFLNEVFLAENPHNDDIYERKTVTLRLMMNSLIPYNKTFEKRGEIAFILWCADHNVRSVREIKVPECILYTLKHEYRDNVAKNIAYILPYHQERIKYLKKEGHNIVGYCRKFIVNKDRNVRTRLMQRMVDTLFERSLVEKVFVSPCVSTFGSIATRDRGFYERMEDPAHVAGDMKDLLAYISATEKVYLVVFDLASLTTDKDDLLNFVGANKNLQGIIVDNIPAKNEYHFFTRYQLLNDPNALNDFERNLAPIKRSK